MDTALYIMPTCVKCSAFASIKGIHEIMKGMRVFVFYSKPLIFPSRDCVISQNVSSIGLLPAKLGIKLQSPLLTQYSKLGQLHV